MSRPPYGSHSGSRHACQKRPTSQCGWTRRAAAQTVVAQRVPGRAGNALLRDRGNESLRRRLSEGAPPRGAHAGDGFIVGGSCSRADAAPGSALLVGKSGGKEVSHIEKNSDLLPLTGTATAYKNRQQKSNFRVSVYSQQDHGPPRSDPRRLPASFGARRPSHSPLGSASCTCLGAAARAPMCSAAPAAAGSRGRRTRRCRRAAARAHGSRAGRCGARARRRCAAS